MIPLEVKIKNFLSYGSELQTINFEPHHLICFTGKNGHGKSALLDAITWALWGHARKIGGAGKADSGLVHLGQTDMMVIIDFLSNGNKYRIKREFLVGKTKSQQYLEFGIYEENTDHLKSLTDKTIRATQEMINKSLGVDYETFINSAFIRQGQSNEFSTKSPKERKEILGTILGLERFEKIRKLILDKQRIKVAKKEHLKTSESRLIEELEKEPALLNELQEIKNNLAIISNQEEELTKKDNELTKNKEDLLKTEHERKLISVELNHILKLYSDSSYELNELITTWRTIHKKRLTLSNGSSLTVEKQQIEEQLKKFELQKQEQITHKEILLTLKSKKQKLITEHEQTSSTALHKISLEKAQLTHSDKTNTSQLNDILLQKSELENQLKKLHTQPITQEEITLRQTKFEKKQKIFARLSARLTTISKELIKIGKRNSLISSNPHCPLCEKSLEENHQQNLQTKFEKQIHFYEHQQKRLSYILKAAELKLKEDKQQLQTLAKQLIMFTKHEETLTILQKLVLKEKELLAHKNILHDKLKIATAHYQELEKEKLNWAQTNESYKELQKQIENTNAHIKNVTFDEQTYKKLIDQIKKIDLIIQEQQNLNIEINNQTSRKQKIHLLCQLLRDNKKQQEPLEKKIIALNENTQLIETLNKQEKLLEQEIKKITKDKTDLLEKKGRIQEQCLQMKKYKEQLNSTNQEIKTIEKEHQSHGSIATALSRDGIQALLIEQALPEIEDETNRILSKLTDNTQQIFIESLKDLKSGGTKETLDIKISDTQGIRPYELFSGGEAFRIDFALRIAISKLLARRAGASLQTLIIDEGFGSQDDEGLTKIMDALHKIQEDFAKVIIVSHLPSVQHEFPTQFHITKNSLGSHIQIIEQG